MTKFFSFIKKQSILFLIPVGLFLLSCPGSASAASIGSTIASAFNGVLRIFFAWVIGLIVYVTGAFALIASGILNLVTGTTFVKWAYTDNPVVSTGLGITKSFVNLALVVILVYIALSTALKLKEMATQRTLARLIAVALLVNFAPFFCGLIIDASNIVTNYFLSGAGDASGMLNGLKLGAIVDQLTNSPGANPLSVIVKGVVMIAVNVGLALALFLFAAIFLARYIAIWLLVILSPLAFVALIIPNTKEIWSKWWKNFKQWTMVGITMSFFLYLSLSSFKAINGTFTVNAIPGVDAETVGLIQQSFSYIIVLIMMYLGFLLGIQTSAIATKTIGWSKTVGKWAGKPGRLALSQTAGRFAQTEMMQGAIKRLNNIRTMGEIKAGEGGKINKGLRMAGSGLWSAVGGRWVTRGMATYRAGQKKDTERRAKSYQETFGDDTEGLKAAYRANLPVFGSMRKAAAARALAKAKGGKGIGEMGQKEFEKATTIVGRYDNENLKNIIKSKPDAIGKLLQSSAIINQLVPKGDKDKDAQVLMAAGVSQAEAVKKAAYKKIVDGMKAEDIGSVAASLDSLKGKPESETEYKEMIEAITRFKPSSFLLKLADETRGEHIPEIQHKMEEIGATQLAMTNASAVGMAHTSAGSQFFTPLKEEQQGPGGFVNTDVDLTQKTARRVVIEANGLKNRRLNEIRGGQTQQQAVPQPQNQTTANQRQTTLNSNKRQTTKPKTNRQTPK